MCRIVGRVTREIGNDFDLKSMLQSVAHGGPDDEGTYFDDRVTLGHRRLSIIDLSKAGHQPMVSSSKDVVISFNGEIYNYLDLKKELEQEGFTFQTKTDTEVIICAYQKWGADSFNKLEGIFAFSLLDKLNDSFFLVRDHLGVKPLYYFINDQELIFSSEVRAFKALKSTWPENEDWKILFLAFGSIPHPFTTLLNVTQLAPGFYLKLGLKDFTFKILPYHRFDNFDYTVNSKKEALILMQFALQKAVKKNLISDAKLGVFLSGGIDSSLITLLADKFSTIVNTISVNFDDSVFDEHIFQQMVLEKTENVEHTAHRVSEHMFWEYLSDIWKAMDQPTVDSVNTYFAARFARNEGIKVVLSGLGADEVFGGYASFKRIKWMRYLRQIPFNRFVAKGLGYFKKSWARFVYLSLPGMLGDYLFLRGIYSPKEIAALLDIDESDVLKVLHKVPFDKVAKMDDAEYASLLETKIYMTNQLLKDTDYMGMWHGVEVRVPFLDVELLRKVRTIPPSIRYNDSWPKYLLTASHYDLIPHKIIFRAKKGFTFPFAKWINRSEKRFRTLMLKGAAADQVFQQFRNRDIHWSKCWSLAVLEQFQRKQR